MAATHYLEPASHTLHGFFDRSLSPALEIETGDTVIYKTPDATWSFDKRLTPGGPRKKFTDLSLERQHDQFGHALVGPIGIKGARPGMTLEVGINEVVPTDYGWTSAGGFPSYWNEELGIDKGNEVTFDFDLDAKKMIGTSRFSNFDYSVSLKPFMGIMGMPPNIGGRHSTISPFTSGGNLDCKELVAGSTLYLPIQVEEGLFSVGDGHAVQGDGEVGGPALECAMEKVSLTFNVLDNLKISIPRAKTPTGWVTMGIHESLDRAMWMAMNEMLDLMTGLYNISRSEANAYATLVVDLRITQIVNGKKGVHAFLPHGALMKK
ncbi:acetamidase/formamidase family protein [Bacillus sp. SCS-153A]|uniref:acetamidase/formamidase family protein n=1 Tax=Rossellomorea sedimentorum TaxID=3115294 RepID=UPI00390603F8